MGCFGNADSILANDLASGLMNFADVNMPSPILLPAMAQLDSRQPLGALLLTRKSFRRLKSLATARVPKSSRGLSRTRTLTTFITNPSNRKSDPLSSQRCDGEDFYRYASGRWIWNEKEQLSCRYVKFNIAALARIATQVTGSKSCVQVQKLSEGNFNKILLIRMDDSKEVIAKLPNPNAGRAHFTTASEVATMDYVRDVLGIPAPEVYAWSSSTQNPVGAEYIIMERSGGIELGKVWEDLPGRTKFEIIKKLVEFETQFVSAQFPMYGSLYYARDLSEALPSQLVTPHPREGEAVRPVFAVGPTTNRTFFDDGRDAVDTNRGPWPSLENYVLARLRRELACVRTSSKFPRQQGFFHGPGQYRPSSKSKADVLHLCEEVAQLLLPEDKGISQPTLWHPDLHNDNIFVGPEQPTEILAIIDWQAVNLSPLFLQARHPALIEFDGPIPEGFESISLPENFEELGPEEQLAAKKVRAAQSLYKLYEIQLFRQCPDVVRALRFRDSLAGQITGLTRSIFSDGEPIVQGMLIRLQEEWSSHIAASIPCPLSFTLEEKNQQKEDEAKWRSGVELMEEFLGQVGAYQGWDGWVNHDSYEAIKERLDLCHENFLTHHTATDEEKRQWMKFWPFVDK